MFEISFKEGFIIELGRNLKYPNNCYYIYI